MWRIVAVKLLHSTHALFSYSSSSYFYENDENFQKKINAQPHPHFFLTLFLLLILCFMLLVKDYNFLFRVVILIHAFHVMSFSNVVLLQSKCLMLSCCWLIHFVMASFCRPYFISINSLLGQKLSRSLLATCTIDEAELVFAKTL